MHTTACRQFKEVMLSPSIEGQSFNSFFLLYCMCAQIYICAHAYMIILSYQICVPTTHFYNIGNLHLFSRLCICLQLCREREEMRDNLGYPLGQNKEWYNSRSKAGLALQQYRGEQPGPYTCFIRTTCGRGVAISPTTTRWNITITGSYIFSKEKKQ